jgi:predicted RNase H-like HicB family nuclease
MVEIMTYRALYEREPDGRWTVEIAQVKGCHSHGRTIDQARERIREALGLFVDGAARATIVDDVRLPAAVKRAVVGARQARTKLERAKAAVAVAEAKAVGRLREDMALGHRDAGAVLGLSHQRVHQLEKKAG